MSQKASDDTSLVRVQTAARMCGVSRQGLHYAIAAGWLRARRLDGVIYVSSDDVLAYAVRRAERGARQRQA